MKTKGGVGGALFSSGRRSAGLDDGLLFFEDGPEFGFNPPETRIATVPIQGRNGIRHVDIGRQE